MKNYRIIKGRKISLKEIAARDRKFTVNNMPKTKPTFNKKNLSEVKFGENDVHFVQKTEEWKNTKHPQPKRLHKKQKKWSKWIHCDPATPEDVKGWIKVVKYPARPSNFPNHTIKPLTKEAYWEKLVEHKLKKWEKKNPKPNQDLFESVEEWEQKRFVAEQRFRDFVVSGYNKLNVTATITKPGGPPYENIIIGKVNDYSIMKSSENNGDRTIKEAKEIAMKAMKKNPDILHCQIENFKGEKYRLVA